MRSICSVLSSSPVISMHTRVLSLAERIELLLRAAWIGGIASPCCKEETWGDLVFTGVAMSGGSFAISTAKESSGGSGCFSGD